jgi:hypothetical protein
MNELELAFRAAKGFSNPDWTGSKPNIYKQLVSNVKEERESAMMGLQALVQSNFTIPRANGKIDLQATKLKLQALTTTGDLPDLLTQIPDIFRRMETYDNGWQEAYKTVSAPPDKPYFEIATTTNGIAVRQYAEGQAMQFDKLSADASRVPFLKHGAGLNWTDETVSDRDTTKLMDNLMSFMDMVNLKYTNDHYGALITAANSNTTISYQAGATSFERDIRTINLAAETISSNLLADKYPNMANQPVIIYGNAKDTITSRIKAALSYDNINVNSSPVTITGRPIKFIPSYNLIDPSTGNTLTSTKFLLVVPGFQIRRADKLTPSFSVDRDNDTMSWKQRVWFRYGIGIANVRQCLFFDLV